WSHGWALWSGPVVSVFAALVSGASSAKWWPWEPTPVFYVIAVALGLCVAQFLAWKSAREKIETLSGSTDPEMDPRIIRLEEVLGPASRMFAWPPFLEIRTGPNSGNSFASGTTANWLVSVALKTTISIDSSVVELEFSQPIYSAFGLLRKSEEEIASKDPAVVVAEDRYQNRFRLRFPLGSLVPDSVFLIKAFSEMPTRLVRVSIPAA